MAEQVSNSTDGIGNKEIAISSSAPQNGQDFGRVSSHRATLDGRTDEAARFLDRKGQPEEIFSCATRSLRFAVSIIDRQWQFLSLLLASVLRLVDENEVIAKK